MELNSKIYIKEIYYGISVHGAGYTVNMEFYDSFLGVFVIKKTKSLLSIEKSRVVTKQQAYDTAVSFAEGLAEKLGIRFEAGV